MSEVYRLIGTLTPARTTADWLDRCRAARVPAMAVRDLADVMDDPHLVETGFFRRREHPTEGGWLDMAPPVRFGVAVAPAAPAPTLGEHDALIRSGLWPSPTPSCAG